MTADDALARFSPATRDWFRSTFAAPTAAQAQAWAASHASHDRDHLLVSAPTGSGKTLAAFLAALDRLLTEPSSQRRTRVLYVSPLKALAYDIDRNLRAPLTGITRAAERLGRPVPPVDVGLRSGDTPASERARMARTPPDILITTPESLFLLLTSRARETLAGVETVIVDEVHAVAGTKRGAHLALSLERLQALATAPFQRVGLSATQRPLEEVARFLGGGTLDANGAWKPRPVRIVDAGARKELEVEIIVPVEDMARLGEVIEEPPVGPAAVAEPRRSIWPAVQPRVLDLVLAHRSTIVFANSRRLAERLCARLNELANADRAEGEPEIVVARAHHGSIAREQRLEIESALKAGDLRCVVATSSLELGIDMGAVDLVIQVESPGSVSRGLQRIGRAGHSVGAPSVGKVFPKYRGDLVEAAVVVRRMHEGAIEETRYPRNPLDVLAQQMVAMGAMDAWDVGELLRVVRGAASFAELSRGQLDGVLDMLSGRYPSDEFAELRPRLNWDRVADRVTGRRGAQRLAVTSGGTIPDRGLYGVFVDGEGSDGGRGARRVGELDEEMVYETRPGETIVLGSTTWRVTDITRDQVLVTPAPGEPGKLPFWHGDAPGRPVEVGRAVGAFLREVASAPADAAIARIRTEYGLDDLAAANLVAYVAEQGEAGGTVPTDRTIVVERFRDEIGDWRVCVLSPFGGRVHAPWALAIEARAREALGLDLATMATDDGIVIRMPDQEPPTASGHGSTPDPWNGSTPSPWNGSTPDPWDGSTSDAWDGSTPSPWNGSTPQLAPADLVAIEPDDLEDLVVSEVANSTLFAARFRECAGRALLLPRRRGGSGGVGRTPLWQQRQRASDLLAVASRYGSFPILLETYRECLRDVFDVPALVGLLRDIAARRVRIVQVDTPQASPFASSLLFGYIAGYLYEGDAPLAERRAHALSLDRERLSELLGSGELRELIDAGALAELELVLQRLTPDRLARDPDGVHDLLREIGDLASHEVAARTDGPAAGWLENLEADRRAYRLRVAGEERWAAAEDAARYRDGLGVPVPPGLPEAFGEPVDRPLVDLVGRYARTHGPFRSADVGMRLGLPPDAVELAGKELEREGRLVAGEFRPGGAGQEWCDAGVLRRLRRASLAALRREVEAVEPDTLGRFLPAWQGVAGGRSATGVDRTLEVVAQLQDAPIPASVLERDVLASRVSGYQPGWLDELAASGEVVWVGRGPLGARDGRVSLYLRDQAPLLVPPAPPTPGCVDFDRSERSSATHHGGEGGMGILEQLRSRGASFWPALYQAAGGGSEQEVLDGLWDLVWAGLVTNDTFAPLRALVGAGPRRAGGRRRRPGRVAARGGPPAAAGRWSLVADLTADAPSPTDRAAALAAALLDRHGVLVRDAVAAEDVPGGFSAVYGVLKAMEESGRVRRGYFVEGLGGAQFALPGAVDRLRAVREPGLDADADAPTTLAATDPANPYGAALAWPDPPGGSRHGPRRVAGAHVVLAEGRLVLYLEKGGRSLLTFTAEEAHLAHGAAALAGLVDAGRVGQLRIQRIDGQSPAEHPLAAHLYAGGFRDHPQGLVRRR